MMAERADRAKTKDASTRSAAKRRQLRRLDFGTDVQTSYFFMLNCLLHSRVHTGIESNSEFYDEDVNVYLAHLLNAHIDPKYVLRVSPLIAQTDCDLLRTAADAPSDRHRYDLYRANADFLLLGLSVFDLFEETATSRLPALRTPREIYIGRAAVYYSVASSYANKLAKGESAVAGTLWKLAHGIESYLRILIYMRGHYLDLIRRYSPGELFHLDRAIEEIERGEMIERMRNEFLDTYHAWMKTGVNELKAKLVEQAEILREIDPSFEFTPPA